MFYCLCIVVSKILCDQNGMIIFKLDAAVSLLPFQSLKFRRFGFFAVCCGLWLDDPTYYSNFD